MNALERAWYRSASWALLLAPLSLLFRVLAAARRSVLQARYQGRAFAAPVIVVGNIAVGGAGKTPLIIALAQQLQATGQRPGIVSRGYGGAGNPDPVQLGIAHTPAEVGDEPRLIADSTGCPVVVCPDRARAVDYLLNNNDCDVVLSDDGLQHYRLHRDLEIAVVDGTRGLGNGWCLPAGPLREPPARLREVDRVVVNGAGYEPDTDFSTMTLRPARFRHLVSGKTVSPQGWDKEKRVHAVAGIANPQRFQRSLEELGFSVTLHVFPDHHYFSRQDLSFTDNLPIIITAKDAVKCRDFVCSNNAGGRREPGVTNDKVWVLDVEAELPASAWEELIGRINSNSGNDIKNGG